jgi:hypothetical protein
MLGHGDSKIVVEPVMCQLDQGVDHAIWIAAGVEFGWILQIQEEVSRSPLQNKADSTHNVVDAVL